MGVSRTWVKHSDDFGTTKSEPRAAGALRDVSGVTLDALALDVLLSLGRTQDPVAAGTHAARLRALLGPAAAQLDPHMDILVRRAAELQRAERQALTDVLTGLANRRALDDALRRELARGERSQQPLSMLLIDLDGFKAINDRFGHATGDEALQLLARSIQRATREGDLAARIGGDEFAVCLPATRSPEARLIGDRIRAELERVSTAEPRLQVSLGHALTEPGRASASALLAAADADLYRDKAMRKTLRPNERAANDRPAR